MPFLAKIQNGRHFWGDENFLKIAKSTFLRYPVDEIALSCTVKEIEVNLCFSIFWQKFENTKWPPFLGRGKFFENCQEYIAQIRCGSKISMKSLYLCFAIFDKNSKITKKNFPILGERNFFFENCQEYNAQIPCFDEISLSRTVKEIEANLCFAIFSKNSKIQNGHHFW